MSLITWSDTLSVGIPAMDIQHQKLVNMINQLNDAMCLGKGREALGDILNELLAYTNSHFRDEEKMLREANFIDFEMHKKTHDAFRQDVIKLKKDFESGNVTISIEVMEFLSDWLTEHIMGMDKEYSRILAPTV